ncbi:hypothetical protein, partial [Shigella sonnei]|uniref:hypothetical protein n=2 Tax=Shigella sonnei TaxID=624 RepID=UPI001C0A6ED3
FSAFRQVRGKIVGVFLYGLLKLFSAFRHRQTAVVSAIRPECLMAHSAVFWLSGPRGSQKPLNNDPQYTPFPPL